SITSHLSRFRPSLCFLFTYPPPSEIYTLSLHDALPICLRLREEDVPRLGGGLLDLRCHDDGPRAGHADPAVRHHARPGIAQYSRSEEHTSELQSRFDLVCRLLLEKKKEHN